MKIKLDLELGKEKEFEELVIGFAIMIGWMHVQDSHLIIFFIHRDQFLHSTDMLKSLSHTIPKTVHQLIMRASQWDDLRWDVRTWSWTLIEKYTLYCEVGEFFGREIFCGCHLQCERWCSTISSWVVSEWGRKKSSQTSGMEIGLDTTTPHSSMTLIQTFPSRIEALEELYGLLFTCTNILWEMKNKS